MAKITLKLNANDLKEILRKGEALEKEMLSNNGAVYSYMLAVSNGYKTAVLSGIGRTTTGVLTLKEFLGSAKSVSWKPNAIRTLKRKAKNGWFLTVWKASGETEQAVQIYTTKSSNSVSLFSGIDGSVSPAAYEHAIRTEFESTSIPGNKRYDGRALFTLLNAVLADQATVDKINAEIHKAIAESIQAIGWGK